MHVDLDQAWLVSILLVSCRVGATFILTPLLGGTVPAPVRALLVLGLSVALTGASGARYTGPLDFPAIVAGLVAEAVVGASLAFGLLTVFAMFATAGQLLDVQVGFGLGSVLNPMTRERTPLLATALNVLAVTVFYLIDGHLAVMRGIAFSLQRIPLGTPALADPVLLVRQFGLVFSMALTLIAPAFFCLLLVEAACAVVSRVLPQANVLLLAAPVKIAAGLSVLALSAPLLAGPMARAMAGVFIFWDKGVR